MSRRKRHRGSRVDPRESKCLGVFGLSVYTSKEDLEQVFRKFGRLKACTIVVDRKTKTSRGFGFVTYEDIQDAVNAKHILDCSEIDGKRMRVDFSITTREHTPTPGVYMGTHWLYKRHDMYRMKRSVSPIRGERYVKSPTPTSSTNQSPTQSPAHSSLNQSPYQSPPQTDHDQSPVETSPYRSPSRSSPYKSPYQNTSAHTSSYRSHAHSHTSSDHSPPLCWSHSPRRTKSRSPTEERLVRMISSRSRSRLTSSRLHTTSRLKSPPRWLDEESTRLKIRIQPGLRPKDSSMLEDDATAATRQRKQTDERCYKESRESPRRSHYNDARQVYHDDYRLNSPYERSVKIKKDYHLEPSNSKHQYKPRSTRR